eukprot:6543882-Pyramimonas_sp.AAC.1
MVVRVTAMSSGMSNTLNKYCSTAGYAPNVHPSSRRLIPFGSAKLLSCGAAVEAYLRSDVGLPEPPALPVLAKHLVVVCAEVEGRGGGQRWRAEVEGR